MCVFDSRRGCVFSHELDLDHNEAILKEHELEHLSRTELCTLLLQSDNRLLPQTSNLLQGVPHDLAFKSIYANIQALKYYDIQSNRAKSGNQQLQVKKGNRNQGRRGGRRVKKPSFTTSCLNLTPAEGAISTTTMGADANSCDEQLPLVTPRLPVPGTYQQSSKGSVGTLTVVIPAAVNAGAHQQLQRATAASNIPAAVNNRDNKDDGSNTKGLPIDKSEICMAFIKGDCKNLERCVRAHYRMPYRWQIKKSGQWFLLPNNEEIERDFCDPKMTDSSSSTVNFDRMTCGFHKARRISTCNSLLEPDSSLATEWLWYWEDEFGKWNLYASPDGGHGPADVDSSVLERRFLSDANDVVKFSAHSQKYCLRFKDMLQTNITYGTKKAGEDGLGLSLQLMKPGEEVGFAAIPNHWDKIQLPQTGYKRVPLVSSSDEYKEVKALFRKTMRGFDISKIERIQNKALWEAENPDEEEERWPSVLELKLFHGTDNQHVDTICHSNLDWRLCGSHGTAYGKEYRRPPSKDGGDINFYDSCVDNVRQPSIYVVFDKPQIYPEYLLQYREKDFTSVLASGISRSSGQHTSYVASQASTPSYVASQASTPSYVASQEDPGEHELDDLSREELCTLLMQSDDQMLPPICHDYNNGPRLFGQCQGGYGCRRVHICERFLNHDCRCSRNHTFRAPHTLKVLHDIPEHLIHSLRSTYANIQAVKYHKGRLRSDRLHGDNLEQSF
ncbi:Poly [ADP-ribose] polymerase 12 [Takifugu flavidus]|uniref:Poly [ADP-ribose] polymerase 12 n=1 Tax=Takifugu flavidus TaxID=433684 RepID=A0A5C6NC66_9TELE|nr:Poly [ADP-ribose] polymerase 12 [Takifugu flavidus]